MLRNGSRRHGRGIPSPFRYFLCVLYLSGLACSADPVGPAETGIEGQVLRDRRLRDPRCGGKRTRCPSARFSTCWISGKIKWRSSSPMSRAVFGFGFEVDGRSSSGSPKSILPL